MWATLTSLGAAFVGAFGSLFKWMTQSDARRAAKAEGQAEFMRDTIENVDKANKAARDLHGDSDYDKRLRDKYTRPDD
jgi:hypothetical protein